LAFRYSHEVVAELRSLLPGLTFSAMPYRAPINLIVQQDAPPQLIGANMANSASEYWHL
jgi:hypothetical protein